MKRKVHSLIDKVYGPKNLELAWEKVRRNRGSAGVDGITISRFEKDKEYYLGLLHEKLANKSYQPRPVKRVEIPKPTGGERELGIPAVIDRVCQQALTQRMEPIFEPKLRDCAFGYRKGRSPHQAMRKVWGELSSGYLWVVDADLKGFFDTIDHEKLIDLIAEEISDGRVLKLTRDILGSGALGRDGWRPTLTGVPQGGVISPLWSNIFLTPFDALMTKEGFHLTRWADDFLILCKGKKEARDALSLAKRYLLNELGVTIHPEKTKVVHINQGFEFLGYKVKRGKGLRLKPYQRTSSANPLNLYAVPRQESVERFRNRIRNLTQRKLPVTLEELIDQINPVIRGWGNYYHKAHVRGLFNRLDRWIETRIRSFLAKRFRNELWRQYPTSRLIEEYGLVRLTHLIPDLTH